MMARSQSKPLMMSDAVLECVMESNYMDDPSVRDTASLVCKSWHQMDSITRKHITIALCYSTTPQHLRTRFPNIKSLKLKGNPRASMFNLIPRDWGGYAAPWINETGTFRCLKSIHFVRMIISDQDLQALVHHCGRLLLVLKMERCWGFSTDALKEVARSSCNLKTLSVEESTITENDGDWLHELALRNTVLETLNFHMTELRAVHCTDLEMIASQCKDLKSVKISDSIDVGSMVGFFSATLSLEEFAGGSFNDHQDDDRDLPRIVYDNVRFPPRLCSLGLSYITQKEMHIIFPSAAYLNHLDLQYTFLNTEDHCDLLRRCPRLRVLQVRNVIGDQGLDVVADTCKFLKRLRIERGEDEEQEGTVTQRGVSRISQECSELEYLAVYVSDITNEALEILGTFSKNLSDFRLVLLDNKEIKTDLPLDDGVRALLRGCIKLRRFALYLRQGGLTDVGMEYIGLYSPNVVSMLLGYIGESDAGLAAFSRGCPCLKKLEFRGCCFSETALLVAMKKLKSLKYIWVQGHNIGSEWGRKGVPIIPPYWNIEFIPTKRVDCDDDGHNDDDDDGYVEMPAQIIGYCSLAGVRTDHPQFVVPLF